MKTEIIKCDVCGAEGANMRCFFWVPTDGIGHGEPYKHLDLCPDHAVEAYKSAERDKLFGSAVYRELRKKADERLTEKNQ